ncbi:helix-turn-helix domain-containing protein [Demequina sp. SYSU T00039]|uniref:Helix-turn-helix domain-containing protein n=1 Tax=Demequina lignilytica TaxID=3051663 RepID=A0AAW7M3D9_9MICO|nr:MULTISPECIES: helix-turn-helix domain-containing protein [unclassified Demequina]MDN4486857.1 helix-turn-helix domain-containing protein [Demequina sp. SYSU T00039]MDN4489541.1 helix-turn-helix domain-containing protein [Demequina sp. SYSU T00068]
MYSESELVVLPRALPARVMFVESDGMVPPSRRDESQLIFVVHGRPTVVDDEDEVTLEPDDVYLANARRLVALESDDPFQVIVLRLDVRRLDESLDEVEFRVNSAAASHRRAFRPLLHLLALVVKANATEDEQNRFKTLALLYALLDELTRGFIADPAGGTTASDKHRSRMRRLLRYIDEHYAEALTLNQVAAHEHLSAPYLSAFFKENVGMTFSAYYNALRLDRAVDDLVTTDESVETVARRNGFRDPRAFVKVFKERFGVLPSQYRRDELQKKEGRDGPSRRSTTARPAPDSPLALLAKYLPEESDGHVTAAFDADPLAKVVAVDAIDVTADGRALHHAYRKVTTVGRAKELLYQEVRDMLAEWQADVGFEYIKFHGLFADDMHVYREDRDGRPVYSFVLLDKVLDFLLSIGLRPFVELSFTPQEMASIADRTVFSAPFNVSPPASLEGWTALVEAFVRHAIDRYGHAEVSRWLFSPWNEPDTGSTLFGFDDDALFYDFYDATYDAVKRSGTDLAFGSPAMLVSYAQDKDWLLAFLDHAEAAGRAPDFLTVHFYDNDFSRARLDEHSPGEPAGLRLNKDQDTFHKTVRQLRMLLQERGMATPVYMTEWNLTVSHRDLLNDTTFKSCYLAKNLLENYDDLDSFGYWMLTDLVEELQPSDDMFHGGLGLYTYNGVKKPHYYVLAALRRAGDRLLASGEGHFVTASDHAVQIYLYNYEHFSHLFASGERYDMTYLERYAPFSEVGRMDVSLELTGLAPGTYRQREEVINADHGSAFDTWLRMGAPSIDPPEVDYIRQVSVPQMIVNDVEAGVDGTLTVSAVLEPLEVRVIELVPRRRAS